MTLLIVLAMGLSAMILIDLLAAGGAMTSGAVGATCGAMGTPWGWLGLLAMIALGAALLWPRLAG